MKIRGKLSLLSAGLVLLVLALTGILQEIAQKRALLAEQNRNQADAVRQLVRVCEDALLATQTAAAARYARTQLGMHPMAYSQLLVNYTKTLLNTEPIRFVALVATDGTPLFHSGVLRGDASFLIQNQSEEEPTRFALAARSLSVRERSEDGVTLVEYAHPVKRKGEPVAGLRVGFDRAGTYASIEKVLAASRKRFLIAAIACFLVGILGAAALAHQFHQPLERLVEGARRIGDGDLKHKIPEGPKDEFGELSSEFNAMAGRLSDLDELKKSFLDAVTHDLRSPLQVIKGYSELLLSDEAGPINEKQRSFVEMISKCGEQVADLANNILDISKFEAGNIPLDPSKFRINNLAEEVCGQLSILAKDFEVELKTELSGEIGDIEADRKLVRRLLTNLINNALKFTLENGTVTVRTAPEDPDGVRVSVQDTGMGIPEDKVKYLFTKFFQVPETRDLARKRGTGLGLTICKQIVEAHGGRIWVESQWKKGTTFTFALPARLPETKTESKSANT